MENFDLEILEAEKTEEVEFPNADTQVFAEF